jgi:hypothetical protein
MPWQEIPNSKRQIPNNCQFQILKVQNRWDSPFGYLDFDFRICLEFGAWDLEFRLILSPS